MRIKLIVFNEFVEAVNERSVVQHIISVDRVSDPIVIERRLGIHRQAEVVGRRRTLSNEKKTVKRGRMLYAIGETVVAEHFLGGGAIYAAMIVADRFVCAVDFLLTFDELQFNVFVRDFVRRVF